MIKWLIFFILILFFLSMEGINAQPGSLDKSFGDNGIVLTKIGPRDNFITSLAIQQDTKIITAGGMYSGTHYEFTLARYDTNGVLDQDFGINGIVTTSISPVESNANSINIQPDGKLVVAGYASNGSYYDFALARYNNNGSLDSTFGSNGIVITSFGKTSIIQSSVLEADGKIIAIGNMGAPFSPDNNVFALCRYNIDGHLDETFGTGGKVLTNLGSVDDAPLSVKIRKNGKIVVCGWSFIGVDPNFALAQYNYDGTLDKTFGTNGIIVTSLASGSSAWSLAIQSNDKVIVVGYSYDGQHDNFTLVRYNTDGSIDSSFGSNGNVVTKIGSGDNDARSVNLQLDGKILVTGISVDSNLKKNFALALYDTLGNLNKLFGMNGIETTKITPFDDLLYSSTIQSNGKIITGGEGFYNDSCSYFVLAQYLLGLNLGIIDNPIPDNSVMAYPNPCNKNITIAFELKNNEKVTISIYNIVGQPEGIITDRNYSSGEHQLKCNVSNLSPGSYIYTFKAGDFLTSGKLAVIR
jgi:uncharacterized delta-60 repeat protein